MLSGEGSKIVEEAGCGYIASSGDYKKLALNVINMSKLSSDELKEMGTKARRYSDIEFNRDKLISQLEGWFIELLNNSEGLGNVGKGHPSIYFLNPEITRGGLYKRNDTHKYIMLIET